MPKKGRPVIEFD